MIDLQELHMKSDLRFHVHDDLDVLQKVYPIALIQPGDVYIMQEDRIVYVGPPHRAITWMKINEDVHKKSILLTKRG